ncbi:hypothetical protein MKW92_042041 [Papaver armeniacum]|nr:hypothetical protein MKW92_042041 [Papaver armeniacum]
MMLLRQAETIYSLSYIPGVVVIEVSWLRLVCSRVQAVQVGRRGEVEWNCRHGCGMKFELQFKWWIYAKKEEQKQVLSEPGLGTVSMLQRLSRVLASKTVTSRGCSTAPSLWRLS